MDNHVDLAGKVVLITGGNSGIGRAAAVDLARMGATVVITARDAGKGAAALAEIERRSGARDAVVMALDLGDMASIRTFAAEFSARFASLEVLVNNAGAILSERLETSDGIEATFGVNHLGHFLLTDLLVDLLRASAPSRIVNVSSLAHRFAGAFSFADPLFATRNYDGTRAYNESKLANLLFTMEMAERLAGSGVTVNAVHPGPVRTGFGAAEDTTGKERLAMAAARPFLISPERGARTLVYLAASPEVEGVTGGYFVRDRQHTPSKGARDPVAARQLWELSESLVASAPGSASSP